MSVQALTWVMDFSETGGTDRLLMFTLGHHADNDGGFVAIARSRMASETRMSEITVKRILDRLLLTAELAEALERDAPEWWLAIRKDRRPRLFRLPLFAATRAGVTNEPPRAAATGVTTGARRGRDGVHLTGSDLPVRDANNEHRKEPLRSTSENDRAPDESCIRCHGSGVLYGSEVPRRCSCTFVIHPAVLLAGQR